MLESALDVTAVVGPLRRHTGQMRVLRLSLDGLTAGVAPALAALLLGVVSPAVLVLVPAAGLLAGALLGLRHWPDVAQAARLADRTFGLQDRLITAWELRSCNDPPAVLQRREVAHRLEGEHLPLRVGTTFHPAHWLLAAAAVLTLGLALHGAVGTRRTLSAADAARIRHAALVTVPHVLRSTERSLSHPAQAPSRRAVRRILHALKRQLLHAPSRAAALRALSIAQMQLRSQPSNAPLARALLSTLSPGERRALGRRPALGRLLAALAGKAGRTPARRTALARALTRDAGLAGSRSLARSLRSAARALMHGNPAAAGTALRAAGRSRAADNGGRSQLLHAAGGLDQVKNEVAGLNGAARRRVPRSPAEAMAAATASAAQGKQPTALRQGGINAATHARLPPNQSRTISGAPLAVQPHRMPGAGAAGAGRTSGVAGVDGHSMAQNHKRGHYVTVRIPGPHGGKTIRFVVGQGPVRHAAPAPYHVLLVRYRRQAMISLQRGAVPPSLQHYVMRYFWAVTHG